MTKKMSMTMMKKMSMTMMKMHYHTQDINRQVVKRLQRKLCQNEAAHSGDGGEDEDDEDEDLYDQEIEDEDEDDEVIGMDEHSHSDGRKNSLPKCLFDEDDDIEDLLAPRPDEPGPKTVIPIVVVNAKESDSEKEVPLKKNSSTAPDKEVVLRSIIDSDDEFDHFYD
ncbi:uncharacterized protein LOC134439447 [Engraulis encrasicolus]|uniref:uncharacterized protein LOC134439447 n=1 Tax=Engraulis encrasicolus TaxID=184585 RepID=UPI002FD0B945